MHDLLFFLCVTKGKYDIDNEKYIQISSASFDTRQAYREDFKHHAFPNTEDNTIFGIVERYFSTYSDNISISSVTTYKP